MRTYDIVKTGIEHEGKECSVYIKGKAMPIVGKMSRVYGRLSDGGSYIKIGDVEINIYFIEKIIMGDKMTKDREKIFNYFDKELENEVVMTKHEISRLRQHVLLQLKMLEDKIDFKYKNIIEKYEIDSKLDDDQFVIKLLGVKGHWMSLNNLFAYDNFKKEIAKAREKGISDQEIIDKYLLWCIEKNEGCDFQGFKL